MKMKKPWQKDRGKPGKPNTASPALPSGHSAPEDTRRPRFSLELSILYEDDAVVVIDKPSGLLAVPIKGSQTPSAWTLLADRLERKKQGAFLVHRIDRFSSGALLF